MHPAEPQDELLQCFDENGNPLEIHTRAEVKQEPPRWWYGTVRVYVVNDKGQLMVSKRAEGLSGNPGKWQTYFGGHVGAGTTHRETAQRELEEEAGIKRPVEDFFFVDKGRNEEKKVFFENYAVRFNGGPSDLHFTDNEVTEAKWMDMDEYMNDLAANPDKWCNSCPPERQEVIKKWLREEMEAGLEKYRSEMKTISPLTKEEIHQLVLQLPNEEIETKLVKHHLPLAYRLAEQFTAGIKRLERREPTLLEIVQAANAGLMLAIKPRNKERLEKDFDNFVTAAIKERVEENYMYTYYPETIRRIVVKRDANGKEYAEEHFPYGNKD